MPATPASKAVAQRTTSKPASAQTVKGEVTAKSDSRKPGRVPAPAAKPDPIPDGILGSHRTATIRAQVELWQAGDNTQTVSRVKVGAWVAAKVDEQHPGFTTVREAADTLRAAGIDGASHSTVDRYVITARVLGRIGVKATEAQAVQAYRMVNAIKAAGLGSPVAFLEGKQGPTLAKALTPTATGKASPALKAANSARASKPAKPATPAKGGKGGKPKSGEAVSVTNDRTRVQAMLNLALGIAKGGEVATGEAAPTAEDLKSLAAHLERITAAYAPAKPRRTRRAA